MEQQRYTHAPLHVFLICEQKEKVQERAHVACAGGFRTDGRSGERYAKSGGRQRMDRPYMNGHHGSRPFCLSLRGNLVLF